MSRILFTLLLLFMGCADTPRGDQNAPIEAEDEHGHAEHGPTPAPTEPALGPLSLYQLDSPWTDDTGSERSLESLSGIPVLAAMTYTSCQVSCPVIVADLKRIETELNQAGVEARIVLFSLDPDRDTPQVLASFKEEKGLSSRWVLLRAPDDQVREMAALLGVNFRRTPDGEVAHANIISILDPGGQLIHQQLGLGAGKAVETASVLIDGAR